MHATFVSCILAESFQCLLILTAAAARSAFVGCLTYAETLFRLILPTNVTTAPG